LYAFVKLLAALLSAVILSAIFTFNERPSVFEQYSFAFVFLQGSLILFLFYLLGGIPLSILADRIVHRYKRKLLPQSLLYFLFGVGLAFIFVLWRAWAMSGDVRVSAELPLLFGLGGLVFFVFQSLLAAAIRSLMK